MSNTVHAPPSVPVCEDLIRQLESLRRSLIQLAANNQPLLLDLPPDRRPSAENLLHYLALRSRDLRPLQRRLNRLGLSSPGQAETGVLPAIETVLGHLYRLNGDVTTPAHPASTAFEAGPEVDILGRNTRKLLGSLPGKRRTHIMVTLSSEAAEDYLLVHRLVNSGMDCLRVNCSHNNQATWARTIEHLHDAERATGRSCRILMDLGGPKLRIGPMEAYPAVLKVRPRRNEQGQVIRPARIWLHEENTSCEMDAADANLQVDAAWLKQLASGDRLRLTDSRGSGRTWRIREVRSDGCWAEAKKTAYLSNGTILHRQESRSEQTTIRNLPPTESFVLLKPGEVLIISGSDEPGRAAIHNDNGDLLNPGRINLPVPEIYRDAHPGERVCFDDGRIVGMIEKVEAQQLHLRITHTRKPVEQLRRDKGVNFPDTRLDLPALGAKDLADLKFAAENADMIGLSFANCREDVSALRKHLDELGCETAGVVLKIETRRGFTNLPDMLFEAMKFPTCGVMIARGDLGVECGFERMVEVQDEIVRLCEAAHVPVIWATQVLENLAKRGHATRAEVTDAGMGNSAECVMLNKGPYIVETVTMLDDILQRMQRHYEKQHSQLGELQVASAFTARTPGLNV
jgi:pyruvate kinase